MVKATLANSLWWCASAPSSLAFASALNDPDAAQRQIFRAFLRKNSDTAFGREHRLIEVRTHAEFARRIPIRNYDEIHPWIDRIRHGEPHVLTAEPVKRLVPTSGSTSARKLIPYTASMHRQINRAVGPWIFDLYRQHPQALFGTSYWSISPAALDALPFSDDSKVPIGFDDDAAYLGALQKYVVNATMAVPLELKHIPAIADWQYGTSLCLLRRADLTLISVWHPSFLSLLLRAIQNNWEQLLADISSGECHIVSQLSPSVAASVKAVPDLRRARELRSIGPAMLDRLWPKLKVVSCWADGHAAGAAADLARSMGSVHLQPKGLIATEGVISIPYSDQHPLAVRSHFLEFENDAGHVLLASELRESHEYNVILTTDGGLCRYRLADRIKVDGKLGRTPSISFLGKSSLVSDRMGEKLSDGFVASILADLFRDAPRRPSFTMLAPDIKEDECRYTLYINSDLETETSEKLDHLLSANPQYEYCRRLGQLQMPCIFRITGDPYAHYCARLQRTGKRLGDIKPVALSCLDDWSNQFTGNYLSQRISSVPN